MSVIRHFRHKTYRALMICPAIGTASLFRAKGRFIQRVGVLGSPIGQLIDSHAAQTSVQRQPRHRSSASHVLNGSRPVSALGFRDCSRPGELEIDKDHPERGAKFGL